MKKLPPKRLPRRLVLRGEAIAQLTSTQLDQIAAGDGSWLQGCQQQSNFNITCVDVAG